MKFWKTVFGVICIGEKYPVILQNKKCLTNIVDIIIVAMAIK